MLLLSALDLARTQFGFTIAVHIIFPASASGWPGDIGYVERSLGHYLKNM